MADTGAPWNLPYPLPTDLVRDGADAIKDLAEAVADGLDSAGKVLQVVRATDTTRRTTTSTTYNDVTGMTVSITPTSATSTIIVRAVFIGFAQSLGAGFSREGQVRLVDGAGTPLSGAEDVQFGSSTESAGIQKHYMALAAQVSAATTDPRDYKLQFRISGTASRQTAVANDLATGQMYAIEVAA